MSPAIAIVGMACRYADAASPGELWENALAQRRAFRRMPSVRLNAADYFSSDPQAPDRTYTLTAALIEDYEFDRVRYRVSGAAYRSADLAHWLALDIAAQAFTDAGMPAGQGLPRQTTGVFVGNTLTGEFSRAAALRLRWPYVRRILSAALAEHGCDNGTRGDLLRKVEVAYKRPFPEVGEETLAGGLSNTIAGRICNHFDLNGGGYTVDGACASSLLAVANACSALAAGDCDAALAGGVDLSLDPFELVGFAKTGALAVERMRVYDVRSGGFWPGEGCGFVVLQRIDDALAQGCRLYGIIRGWGISSDGSGGITRPEADGQMLALERAYRRAGFGPDSVGYFEGHGTGTAVGDATELRALTRARRQAGSTIPAAISSIKANIGHTKAAAGVAGLIKAAMAVQTQVRPPATGCESPHPEMGGELRPLTAPELWPESLPVRAAVSAMGFGGINSHIVLEGAALARRRGLSTREVQLARTPQDAELFLFSSEQQIRTVTELAADLSLAEMTDLAASLAAESSGPLRRAVVASTPAELGETLSAKAAAVRNGHTPRIGFLFPGQGSQNSAAATEIAQPSIVRDSIAALRELRELGIEADAGIGHSLGEITAMFWSGVLDEETALRIASVRGRIMGGLNGMKGAMAGISAAEEETVSWIDGEPVVVAGLNSRRQTVISGEAEAVARVAGRARAAGARAVLLPVSHAFHSPFVEAAAGPLFDHLASEQFAAPDRRVFSTIVGRELTPHDDVRDLLRRQIASPVLFRQALESAGPVDLWIEVGPGRVLSVLAADTVSAPVISVESGSRSRRPFLEAVAAAWETGTPMRPAAIFAGRFTRPFRGRRGFFVNPCELAPADSGTEVAAEAALEVAPLNHPTGTSPLEIIRELVARRTELPAASFPADARLLADLHLNSIVVAQIAAEAARRLNLRPPVAPLEFAGMTVQELASALEAASAMPQTEEVTMPAGIDAWVRAFQTKLVARPLPSTARENNGRPRGEWKFFGDSTPWQNANLPESGGVLLHLPRDPGEESAATILEAGRAAMRLRPPCRFVLVQHGGGGAAFARALHLESRGLPVCVVDVPEGDPLMAERVAAEAAAVRAYSEAHYDSEGTRRVPVLACAPEALTQADAAVPSGVLVVTGGGKGIGAECAIEAARLAAVRLAIVGTTPEAENPAIGRMRTLGLDATYYQADVTDAGAVRSATEKIRRDLGPITGIIHCAGINRPQALETLSEGGFRRTVAVKTRGLANLLTAAAPDPLQLVVAFGSIIARIGMAGEADYALANEWMSSDLDRWAAAHPACRCLTLEWSIWTGTGMGERVARLDALRRMGVSPISIDEGVRSFRQALLSGARGTEVVSGRFGAPPTVEFTSGELPLHRFLERPRVYYPGVELVCDADLSTANDPYLDDHVFSGTRLLPGVLALEAMAQTAMAATGNDTPPAFEQVRFARPVVVPSGGSLSIRLAALVRDRNTVEVCLRSAETGFQTDHFRVVCRFCAAPPSATLQMETETAGAPLDPQSDLYGSLLFQKGRFSRLRAYRRLRATECVAEIASSSPREWFNRYLPQTLVLGDPGMRDAAIHAIQACIPHALVLPTGAAAIFVSPHAPADKYVVQARERHRNRDLLVYDLEITTPEGQLVERWDALELRIVSPATEPPAWPAALLAPYLERRMGETSIPCNVAVSWRADGVAAKHRNGANGFHTAQSHAGNFTLSVSATGVAGCECQPVESRSPEEWRELLGSEGFALAELVAREAAESLEHAATRVWSALKCGRDAGVADRLAIVLASPEGPAIETPGWVMMAAGAARIATWVSSVREFDAPVAFAILVTS